MVIVGQALRSSAMIHASNNFSHAVAFRKLETHRLVTDGVYAYVITHNSFSRSLTADLYTGGSGIHLTQDSSTGHWEPSSCFRILCHSWFLQSFYGDSFTIGQEVVFLLTILTGY